MSKQAVYGIIALIVLIIIGGVVYMQSQDASQEAADTEITETEQTESTTDANADAITPNQTATDEGRFSDESDVMDEEAAVHEISFSGTAYSPAQITIKNGDIVVFKNNSTKDFWPASARHPDHLEYPEFDAKQAIAPGGTFQFKFTKTGAWGFHDHLTPTAFGRIAVE